MKLGKFDETIFDVIKFKITHFVCLARQDEIPSCCRCIRSKVQGWAKGTNEFMIQKYFDLKKMIDNVFILDQMHGLPNSNVEREGNNLIIINLLYA